MSGIPPVVSWTVMALCMGGVAWMIWTIIRNDSAPWDDDEAEAGGEAGVIEGALYSIAALGAVVIYCVVQAVRDFRAKYYAWALAAVVAAIVLATIPIKPHVVKVDIPAPH